MRSLQKSIPLLLFVLTFITQSMLGEPHPPSSLILRSPTLSDTQIAFEYGGHLWLSSRSGGVATQLTSGNGIEIGPAFSPDGKTIAYTGWYNGNKDVFTISTTGGIPHRLTFHPKDDEVVGWTPSGDILFRSDRAASNRYTQLFTVPVSGGIPHLLPLPTGYSGSLSPDSLSLAYSPLALPFGFYYDHFYSWGNYRGGQAGRIWILSMKDLSRCEIPHGTASDSQPTWFRREVYFLSARDGKTGLFSYSPGAAEVQERVRSADGDIDSLSAGPDALIYSRLGKIYIYNPKDATEEAINIVPRGESPGLTPSIVDVHEQIEHMAISPLGNHAAFEAHGDVFTVPIHGGPIRDVTRTPGIMERFPQWSPDGRSISYFSDAAGLYDLYIGDETGERSPRRIQLDSVATYYFDPKWSPDSRSIAFRDNHLRIWIADLQTGKVTQVGGINTFRQLERDYAWSPNSEWLSFTRVEANHLHRLYLYSLKSESATPVTDPDVDVRYPIFDPEGRYLYFTASTNYGGTAASIDMSSNLYQVTRRIFALVLSSEAPPPIAVPSGDSEDQDHNQLIVANQPFPQIDLTSIAQRIVALPLPARDYTGLVGATREALFYTEDGPFTNSGDPENLSSYNLASHTAEQIISDINGAAQSADGKHLLVARGVGAQRQYSIISSDRPYRGEQTPLDLKGMRMHIDPRQEWVQMYHEVWRIERAYFYDPSFHGFNTQAEEKRFEPYVEQMTVRDDLNWIFQAMLGGFSVGHLNGGNAFPLPPAIRGGLLGADYFVKDGRYCIQRVYAGDPWNPTLRAPLSHPSVAIAPGDCIFSINGQKLSASEDIQELLEGTAEQDTTIQVVSTGIAISRTLVVRPTADEFLLRRTAWAEGNQETVTRLSGGRLAYVYLPDTGDSGFEAFNRFYFSQADKEGVVVDERYNSGGQLADYFLEVMNRHILNYWAPRYGAVEHSPSAEIIGPKVMLINEVSGSGGDALPRLFQREHIGPVVGERTWGGLVGFGSLPTLMDGGVVTAPSVGFFSPDGTWDIENHGVIPDDEVELSPQAMSKGEDSQLTKAVTLALKMLGKKNVEQIHPPKYPVYH